MRTCLFSYGTLNDPMVQEYVFQRVLTGEEDALRGYAISNKKMYGSYLVLEHTGNNEDEVAGKVYALSDEELRKADVYEGPAYRRISIVLKSGCKAWVYVERITKTLRE